MKVEKPFDPSVVTSALQKTPIAIIGLGALFPQARTVQQYWDNILREVDCITDVPPSRWKIEEYYDPDPRAPDKTYCKRGGFLPEVDFNPMEFGIPPNVLEATDISQLLSLVAARETLEDAGYGDASGADLTRTGVILGVAIGRQLGVPLTSRLQYPIWERVLKNCGISEVDTQHIIEKMKAAYISWQENSFPGVLGNVVAGRIANRFNLGGTNCVVDAACASSLSAVKMAVSELIEHRCDMMLTGGVDTDNSIMMYMCFSKTPAFSQQENVRPFDENSDGMMVGEGVGMLLLKRLADAERDGDRIYAVIRGIGTSSDGRFKSIYAPRSEGQAQALRRAYQDAGIAPSSMGLIEAHGTGTRAGDPVEVMALNEVFGENNPKTRYIGLGSVKSQIGHTKAAAGAASLIKTSLALYHQILPATINVETPMTHLATEESPFYLNTKTRPWMRTAEDPPRRAGVSAFGFGGTNFHVVLEEHAHKSSPAYRVQTVPEPILLSAQTPPQLLERCTEFLAQLHSEDGADAYRALIDASVATIPPDQPRLGFVAESLAEARALLETARDTLQSQLQAAEWAHPKGIFYRRAGLEPTQKVVALFPGQGSQYLEMGCEVACTMPPLREAFAQIDALFQADGLEPVSHVVYPPPAFDAAVRQAQADALRQTEYAQPAIGALSVGLYTLLQQADFHPDFVLGHSFGELTALWAAGVISEADYFRLVKARGLAMAAPPSPGFDAGAMVAVTGDVDAIQTACRDFPDITVANWNATNQVVLAGPTPAVQQIQSFLTDAGYTTIPLPVSAAFHTELVGHAQQPFAAAIQAAHVNPPQVPVYANATAEPYPDAPAAIQQILADHITQPVLFKQQIEHVYAAGGFCFVEIGPKSTLTNLVKNILADKPHLAVALNGSSKKDSDRQLREAVVQLRVIGLPLTQLDPYQRMQPASAKAQHSVLDVSLNGSTYISEKTQKAIDDALHSEYRLRHPVQGWESSTATAAAPATQENGVGEASGGRGTNGHASRTLPADAVTEPAPSNAVLARAHTAGTNHHNAAQDPMSLYTNGHSNGLSNHHSNNHTNSHGSNGAVLGAQPAQAPTPPASASPAPASPSTAPDYRRVLDGVERNLAQFMEHQNGSARIHEQYLSNQGDYTQIFAQLMQQQVDLVARGDTAPEQLAALRDILETLGRSIAQFHTHQGETTRIHEQYLNQQVESARSFLQILQQQYTGYLGAPQRADAATAVADAPHAPDVSQPPVPAHDAPAAVESPPPAPPAPPVTEPEPREPAPAAPATAVAVETITATLLEIVSDKTGYPVEVLEPEMDMEADLGIDSIKRVEILGAMQEQFPHLPQAEPEALGELRTLGQIIDFIGDSLAARAPAAAPSAAPAATESAMPAAATDAAAQADETATVTAEAIAATLLEIVSDKTGYPVEVLEPEMDMEADLGIDSIKRVEILGAMQEQFPNLPQAEPEALGELRTLGQIIDFIGDSLTARSKSTASHTPDAAPSAAADEHPAAHASTSADDPAPPSPDQVHATTEQLATVTPALRRVIAEITSLPEDVLEPEMDLAVDLGIDRVKRVEIISAVQEQLPELPHLHAADLADLATLGRLAEALAAALPSPTAKPESAPAQEATDSAAEPAAATDSIERQRVVLQSLPPPDSLEFQLAENHICLITDDGGLTTPRLAQALHDRGWPVVVLSFAPEVVPASAADAWAALPESIGRVTLSDMDEAQLARQLEAIAAEHGPVGAFIHLHPILPDATDALAFSAAEKAIVKQVFFAAKHLRQPLNEAARQSRSCFLTVARLDGQFGLGRTEAFGVIGAGLFGLTKSVDQEWPAVFCRAVDVDRTWDAVQTVDAILAELHDPNSDVREVGHGTQGRVTLTTQPAPRGEPAAPQAPAIDASSVFLVSGGAKGITAACVVRLAQQHQCKFILLGRSALTEPEPAWAHGVTEEVTLKKRIVAELSAAGQKPTPADIQTLFRRIVSQREIEETVRQIERAGGQAVYCSVDITDGAALREAVANAVQQVGSISGIIHGAGNLADKWIEKKTEADFELVYSTKVTGLANLLQCVSLDQLRHVMLFGSTAGFYGNVGQTDYALSNEVLNKAAHQIKRMYPDCRVLAVNWGPWDGGMVTPALKRIFAMQNIQVIPIETGTQMFVEELSAPNQGAVQLVISSPVGFGMLSPEVDRPVGVVRTFRVHRTVNPADNPFLRDHTIGGQQVLPLTAAASWMINTCERLNPGYKFLGWTDLKVFKGIVLDDSAPGELTLELQEQAETSTATVPFVARIWSEDAQGKPRYHYQGTLTLAQQMPSAPHYESFILEPDSELTGAALYADGTLFHGPAFQGVERVLHLGPDRLTLECKTPAVPAAAQGQFAARHFDPYTTDVQLQGALIWTKRLKDVGCLPAQIAQFELFERIPVGTRFYVSMTVQSFTHTKFVADIITHDAHGRVYNRLQGAEYTVSTHLRELFAQAVEARS